MSLFKDRVDAGQQLAQHLLAYKNQKDVLILALPRGGVPVASEIAQALHVPMTVFLVRKLGAPNHEEFAIGAVSEDGNCFLHHDIIHQLHISDQQIQTILKKEQQELARRLDYYRQGKKLPRLKDKVIILIDDGIATGATFKAAIQAIKSQHPKKLILAAPVASQSSLEELSPLVDESVCLATPEPFYAVGEWYDSFDQVTDEEVVELLDV